MDALDCKSPTRCATCAHFDRGACQLEEDLLATLAAMEPRRAPARPRTPALAVVDARRALATG